MLLLGCLQRDYMCLLLARLGQLPFEQGCERSMLHTAVQVLLVVVMLAQPSPGDPACVAVFHTSRVLSLLNALLFVMGSR